MTPKHRAILDKFGAELVSEVGRGNRQGAKAYIVMYEGKQYRWATSSVDREVPPWKFVKRPAKKPIYGNCPYVYRMFDESGSLLYIGKTTQLDYRLYVHFFKEREDWKNKVARIDAHRFLRESDMHVYEMYLITTHKPMFNRHASCDDTPSFVLPELDFQELTGWG